MKGAVAVLAPRFPSINQPWMDTYLQQLQQNRIPFIVVTQLETVTLYQEKVDRLSLRKFERYMPTEGLPLLRSLLRASLRAPINTLAALRFAWRFYDREQTQRSRIGATIRGAIADHLLQQQGDCSVIHSHSLGMGYEFLAAATRANLPTVLTFHGLNPKGVPQVAEFKRRLVFEASSTVLVNTRYASAQAESLGCPPERLSILPQGLPLEDFAFQPRCAPQHPEALQIVSVGRFHRDKGQRYSLLAARRLLDAGVNIRWHFVGVGPDREHLKNLCRRLKLESVVEFHEGLSPDALAAQYRTAHVMVLASVSSANNSEHVETQGVVVQEAQASGCIPIVTAVGGLPECVTHEHDGLVITERSHRAIASALQWLLHSPGRWKALQRNGRETVETRFSSDVIGRQMQSILSTASNPSNEHSRC